MGQHQVKSSYYADEQYEVVNKKRLRGLIFMIVITVLITWVACALLIYAAMSDSEYKANNPAGGGGGGGTETPTSWWNRFEFGWGVGTIVVAFILLAFTFRGRSAYVETKIAIPSNASPPPLPRIKQTYLANPLA